MARSFHHRCPECQSELLSGNGAETCPDCGTDMIAKPSRGEKAPHPTDPRYQRPRVNRLPPPTGRNQFPA